MIHYAVILFFDAINGMYGRVRRGTSKAFPDAAPGRTVPLTNIRFLIKIIESLNLIVAEGKKVTLFFIDTSLIFS